TGRVVKTSGFSVTFSVVGTGSFISEHPRCWLIQGSSEGRGDREVAKLQNTDKLKLELLTYGLGFHLLEGFLRGRGLRGFDGLTFAASRASVPLQLDMEHALVRRPECFDDRI